MSTASKGIRMTKIERERIRLNAGNCSASALARLMGRDHHTVAAWANANGVTFGRVSITPPRKPVQRESFAVVERMMALASRGAA